MSTDTIRNLLFNATATFKNKPAVTFLRDGEVETILSFSDLDRDLDRMSSVFLSIGIDKCDRVILFLQKSLIFIVAHLALQKIGAITIPLNPDLKSSEMEYLIQDARPKAILSEPWRESFIEQIDSKLTNLSVDTRKPYQRLNILNGVSDNFPSAKIYPEDPSLIIYTSGTTGKPKGVVLTQRNLANDAMGVINTWEISQKDVFCHALPLFHFHGLCFAFHTALIAGAHVLMCDQFDPPRIIEILSKRGPQQCSVFMAVPAMYGRLMDYLGNKNIDFGHMRLLTSGSAPLLPKDFKRIYENFR